MPRGDGSDGTFNPDQWMDPKDQRKVDDFIIFGVAAATQALADAGWKPESLRRPDLDRRSDRFGHRRDRRHLRCLDHAGREGPAAHFAVLHPRPPHQPRLGLRLDRARPQGAQPFGRDRLLHRRACHRRCGAAGCARRCRRHGGGRRGIADQPAVPGWLCGLQGVVDRLQ